MMIHRKGIGLVAALVLLAACGTKEAPSGITTGPQGRVRFVNLITDPTKLPVNAILAGLPFGVALTYTASTPATLPAPATALYSAILEGTWPLVLKQTTDTTVVVATYSLAITASQDRTVYGIGAGGTTPFQTVDDNTVVPASGQTRFRVVNMAQTVGAVDVFMTATGADLTAATPVASNVLVQGAPYFSLAAGSYQIRFVPAGTAAGARNANVVITIASAAYASGAARTIVAADNAAGVGAARGFVLTDR